MLTIYTKHYPFTLLYTILNYRQRTFLRINNRIQKCFYDIWTQEMAYFPFSCWVFSVVGHSLALIYCNKWHKQILSSHLDYSWEISSDNFNKLFWLHQSHADQTTWQYSTTGNWTPDQCVGRWMYNCAFKKKKFHDMVCIECKVG